MSRRVQTVEATGKVWKLQSALATLGTLAGATVWIVGAQIGNAQTATIGAVAFFLAFFWLLFARAGAWWFHG